MTEAVVQSLLFKIEEEKGQTKLNGNIVSADIYKEGESVYHILSDGISYNIVIHKIDREAKEVMLSVNGKTTTVSLKTGTELLLQSLGLDMKTSAKVENLKAPMPGLIQSILVEAGQSVKKGEPVLILEAMKMENIIKAPSDVTIDKVHVSVKASVEKGAVLVSFK
ncbi:MAG: acetyl-CoA carboxylase biotin carboxyl carrier protein subunit, partial [Bacteroidia bacterium]|nr:acetyl-CoA carboxylase biotin carboxyl carrier protein subunit [Bacteroidia bacterium]